MTIMTRKYQQAIFNVKHFFTIPSHIWLPFHSILIFIPIYFRNYKVIFCRFVSFRWRPDSSVRIASTLRAGRSRDRIPLWGGARFSPPVQTGPWGAHPLHNGYRVFPGGGGKAAGTWRWPATHYLAPRLKEEYSYTISPTLGLRGLL